jgi:hypothetical protein
MAPPAIRGQLVSEQAKRAGLDFIVAGRDAEKIQALAEKLGVPYRVFSVDDAMGLRSALDGGVAILNCAGPFARTARPIISACINTGMHYLDITAEFNVYALAESLSGDAGAGDVMLLPMGRLGRCAQRLSCRPRHRADQEPATFAYRSSGRRIDVARLTLTSGEAAFDVFAARSVNLKVGAFNDDPNKYEALWGIYGVLPLRLLPDGHTDIYYLGSKREDTFFQQGLADEQRHLFGTRLWGNSKPWDYNYEAVIQTGSFGDADILAWTVSTDTGYTIALPFQGEHRKRRPKSK